MARPIKEGVDYFSHDTDAVNDEKIEALRAMFGNDGYAFFFILCERIYRTANAELDISKAALKAQIIAKLQVDAERFEKMMEAAFDVEMFDRESYEIGIITSRGIKRRFDEIQSLRKKWRKKKENNHETELPTELTNGFSLEKTQQETPERKVKESINKETTTTGDVHLKVFGTIQMTGLMSDYIMNLKKQGYTDSFIQELMLETGEAGNKPSLRLMQTIGERWIKEKIYTRVESKRRKAETKSPSRGISTVGKTGEAAHHSPYQQEWAEEVESAEREAELKAAMRGAM